jgi:hypothetical protein
MIARTISINELPNFIFFEMQGFYSGLDGLTRTLYLLAAACYVVAFGMWIGRSLFNGNYFTFWFFLSISIISCPVADRI